MKFSVLVTTLSLSTLAALAGSPEEFNSLSPAPSETQAVSSSNAVADESSVLAQADEQKGPMVQDEESPGRSKGKGKGKAKGHNKDHDSNSDDSSSTPPANNSTQAPSSAAPAATPSAAAPAAPSAPTTVTKAKETTSSAPARSPKEVAAETDKRVRRLNALGGSAEHGIKNGLAAVSQETGVPLATLQAQRTKYDLGVGGLLVCNEIAKASGKPVETFLKERRQDRDWGKIAADAKVDLAPVLPKLDRVQSAMQAAEKSTKR